MKKIQGFFFMAHMEMGSLGVLLEDEWPVLILEVNVEPLNPCENGKGGFAPTQETHLYNKPSLKLTTSSQLKNWMVGLRSLFLAVGEFFGLFSVGFFSCCGNSGEEGTKCPTEEEITPNVSRFFVFQSV